MNFQNHPPVRLFLGDNAMRDNLDRFRIGKKALVVSGKHGADACGAMAEVDAILTSLSIPYVRFTEITENPPAETCHRGGQIARENGCDFVIAIGGGSSLDGAKAIAAYAANPDMGVTEIFNGLQNPCLPLIAIPTTAGTGSEAVCYAVLTLPGGRQKKTFKDLSSFPQTGFVCPKFTHTQTRKNTESTALDAFAHAMESYLSPKSTPESEEAALYAAREVWDVLFRNADGEGNGERDLGGYTAKQRERLSYAACAAGIAIHYTGTGFPHPLGYSLTLTYGIPHGYACALFEGAYIEYNLLTDVGAAKLHALADFIGTTPAEMRALLPAKPGIDLHITPEKAEELINLVADAGNYKNSPYVLTRGEMSDIYIRQFC